VKLFGNGRVALVGDAATADELGWGARGRSRPEPEILLEPRRGDPRRDAWIAPAWVDRSSGLDAVRRRRRGRRWSYLPGPPGVLRYLQALAEPARARRGRCVALAGLGRVGGVAATALAMTPTNISGIRELLIHDVDLANQKRWLLELGSIAAWRAGDELPRVAEATTAEMFSRCDVFLFAATESVPPVGSKGDVRAAQFAPNRAIMRPFLEEARATGFTGLFLVVSDPVDLLAQAAFVDSNSGAGGAFAGDGLAPERIAGLGLGVMWGRALDRARQEGWAKGVARWGAAFGPHSAEVVAFDDVRKPNAVRSVALSAAAREGNLLIRRLGHLPYVGPGVSSVGLTVPLLLRGEEILVSVLVDGVYFGAPARMEWGLYPTARRMAPRVWRSLRELHAWLTAQTRSLGLFWPADSQDKLDRVLRIRRQDRDRDL
jgi:hypothetical protein